jgi:F-type H+-transporting ATPase subunit epsilon
MAARLKVALVTPGKALVRGEFDMVVAPSASGQVGILPAHRPLLAAMDPGPVYLKDGAKTQAFAVSGGFIEVERDTVTILAEAAESAADIDKDRAEAAMKDAEAKLKTLNALDPAYAEQMERVKRNRVRAEVAAS